MPKYREELPQLSDRLFLTDGGIETTLVFHEGQDLPHFAAFDLLKTQEGQDVLRKCLRPYVAIASRFGAGLILEAATWRASADWAAKLGYTRRELAGANRQAIRLLEDLRAEADGTELVISGCLGPRGDGYTPSATMSADEAADYHSEQVETLAATEADMICAMTLNYAEEAIGIVRAAERAEMPVAISFTVETDGCLPTGESLASAIERVDAATASYARYFMINCAHPTHFEHLFRENQPALSRVRGLRANASCRSHAELNESADLDIGNPHELASQYAELRKCAPGLNILGGCCGTDPRHIEMIAELCAPLRHQ